MCLIHTLNSPVNGEKQKKITINKPANNGKARLTHVSTYWFEIVVKLQDQCPGIISKSKFA